MLRQDIVFIIFLRQLGVAPMIFDLGRGTWDLEFEPTSYQEMREHFAK